MTAERASRVFWYAVVARIGWAWADHTLKTLGKLLESLTQ